MKHTAFIKMSLKKINITFLSFLSFVLLSCAGTPRFTSGHKILKKSKTTASRALAADDSVTVYRDIGTMYNDAEVLETTAGIASYYADAFNGKITYNGEVYDMYGISAAHQTYPMGTILRVTNLKNSKSVILRVNDRMPYNSERIIDLSLGAAEQLDMVQDGLAEVRIDVLKFGNGK